MIITFMHLIIYIKNIKYHIILLVFLAPYWISCCHLVLFYNPDFTFDINWQSNTLLLNYFVVKETCTTFTNKSGIGNLPQYQKKRYLPQYQKKCMGYLFQHNFIILCYSVPQCKNTVTSDTSLIYILWTNLVTFVRRSTLTRPYITIAMIRIKVIVYFLIAIGAKIL